MNGTTNPIMNAANVGSANNAHHFRIALPAMLIMTFAFWAYSIAAAMHRLRTGIIEREGKAAWLRDVVKGWLR